MGTWTLSLLARWRAWRVARMAVKLHRLGCVVIQQDSYRAMSAELAALRRYAVRSGHLSRAYHAGRIVRTSTGNMLELLSKGVV